MIRKRVGATENHGYVFGFQIDSGLSELVRLQMTIFTCCLSRELHGVVDGASFAAEPRAELCLRAPGSWPRTSGRA